MLLCLDSGRALRVGSGKLFHVVKMKVNTDSASNLCCAGSYTVFSSCCRLLLLLRATPTMWIGPIQAEAAKDYSPLRAAKQALSAAMQA